MGKKKKNTENASRQTFVGVRPCRFEKKTTYNRKREKSKLQKERQWN